MINDDKISNIDREHIRIALQVVVQSVLEGADISHRGWAPATLRVAMRRHDVRNGVRPPEYAMRDGALLLKQFREHPIGKEYGYGEGAE